MKYGFSKNQLKNACDNLDIDYRHLPEFGIESNDRKNLQTPEDYNALFIQYRKTVLPRTLKLQKELVALFKKNHKIALMCFEKSPTMCHRSHLADSLITLSDGILPLNNL
jgi:uncharacterized protein (DUF488 family)